MAKIKTIKNIGKQPVVQIEVEKLDKVDPLANSYYSEHKDNDGQTFKIINKNCNGPHVPLCIGGKTQIILDNSDGSVDINSTQQKISISASKLYKLIKDGKRLKALSYNHSTGMVESKPIIAAYNNGKQELLKITRSSGKPLWCTDNHKVYSVKHGKYMPASELEIGSKILITNKKQLSTYKPFISRYLINKPDNTQHMIDKQCEQVLIGSLLGDGAVDKRCPNNTAATYMKNHGPKQIEYALWKKQISSNKYKFLIDRPSISGFKPESIGIHITSCTSVDCMNLNSSIISIDTIENIEYINAKRTVYDFTIQDNHNFFAGGILVHNCVVDEIDTVSGEGLRAFKDISGMLDSRGDQKALRVGISTRKSRYGLMNKQIEEAEKAGRTVKKWTTLEFTERCPDSRSGTKKTIAYVNQDEVETITKEQYLKKHKTKQVEYFEHEFYGEKCIVCPMSSLCLSDAKKQISKSPMLKPITDSIKKVKEEGAEWAISQLFNLKPSVEGIIYKEFDEKMHVKTWNQMWYILTGKEFPGECNHDIFIRKCHQMKLTCYGGIDWGWSNPSTVVYIFVDNRENIYVVRAEGMTYISNPNWIQMIKNKWHNMYRCQLYFPDLANPGDGFEMRKAGLPCPTKVDKSVESGIQTVKKWLKPLGSPAPKIFFAGETCQPLIEEFSLFHFKTDAAGAITDTPEKEHDHWLDALRYCIFDLFGKSSVLICSDLSMVEEKPQQPDGSYLRPPTPTEFAASQGLVFNAEVDTRKLGKIGTLNDLDDDNDDDQEGFLWSFT